MHLAFRMIVEVEDGEEARRLAVPVVKAAESVGQLLRFRVQQYWKIKGNFELFVLVKTESSSAHREVADKIGSGWKELGAGNELVWNHWYEGAWFCLPQVRWAHVELT